MRLVFLGTGGAWPTKHRNVSSTAVVLDERVVLVDCGEGTQRQIHGVNFSFMRISHVLITHFHTDHFLGLFGLIESMYLNDRTDKLTVIGPRRLSFLMESLRELGMIKRAFPLETVEVEDGSMVDVGGVVVTAFGNTHGENSFGYVIAEHRRPGKFHRERALELGIPEGPLFGQLQRGESVEVNGRTMEPDMVMGPRRPGRKLAFSGDTHACEALVAAARDADVLVHEATYADDNRDKADEYRHSTARMAAEAARDAGARMLVLTHVSPRYDEGDVLLDEAAGVFPATVLAEDLLELRVPYRDSGREIEVVREVSEKVTEAVSEKVSKEEWGGVGNRGR